MSIEDRLERIERMVILGFKKVLNVGDVALLLGVSESRVRHLVADKEIPHYKPNGRIYFNKEEIENYLLRNRRPSKTEIDSAATTRLAINRMK